PAERPADATALLSALAVTSTDPTLRSSARVTTTASKARPRAMLVAAVVLVSVLAGGAWFAKSGAWAAWGRGSEASTPSLAVMFGHGYPEDQAVPLAALADVAGLSALDAPEDAGRAAR